MIWLIDSIERLCIVNCRFARLEESLKSRHQWNLEVLCYATLCTTLLRVVRDRLRLDLKLILQLRIRLQLILIYCGSKLIQQFNAYCSRHNHEQSTACQSTEQAESNFGCDVARVWTFTPVFGGRP
jgi:hypothetical protein